MKRFIHTGLILCLLLSLCACGGPAAEPAAEPTAAPAETSAAAPTESPAESPEPAGGETEGGALADYRPADVDWQGIYGRFLEDNFDVIAALWPDGISGVGYLDLDLDGVMEMVLFDMGASATLGAQIFDIADGDVVCVSSVNEAAAAAFGGEYFSALSVCASYFEDFRLVGEAEPYFRVKSANGDMTSCWEEQIRFVPGEPDTVLQLESLCRMESRSDVESGTVAEERFFVAGVSGSKEDYEDACAALAADRDLGYEAAGVFLWNDMERYDTSLEGLLAMAEDAAAACVPLV